MQSKIIRDIVSFAKPYGYIYKIENIINGKIYIGQTTNKKGVRNSFTLYAIQNDYNFHLINSVNLYGIKNFKRKIIDSAKDKEELDKKEEYYIQKYNTLDRNFGYNLKHGGANGKASEETKRKMGEALKGRIPWNKGRKMKPHSEETKKKISIKMKGENNHMYGKHLSKETKLKISRTEKGKIISEESKRKMSESRKGKIHSLETKRKMSKSHKGKKRKPFSEEHKKRISESHKGKTPWNKGMNKEQMKQYRENK